MPNHLRAQRAEAPVMLVLGGGAMAREAAGSVLEASEEDGDTTMLVATCRFESGDPAAALDALDIARRLAPARADVLRWIGNITRSLGDVAGAIDTYRPPLQLSGAFAAVRFDLAHTLDPRAIWAEQREGTPPGLCAVAPST